MLTIGDRAGGYRQTISNATLASTECIDHNRCGSGKLAQQRCERAGDDGFTVRLDVNVGYPRSRLNNFFGE